MIMSLIMSADQSLISPIKRIKITCIDIVMIMQSVKSVAKHLCAHHVVVKQ